MQPRQGVAACCRLGRCLRSSQATPNYLDVEIAFSLGEKERMLNKKQVGSGGRGQHALSVNVRAGTCRPVRWSKIGDVVHRATASSR